MGIIYLGDEERVSRELAEVKDALDARYREILGEEEVRRLYATSSRVLTSRSYYSDISKLHPHATNSSFGSNKFMVASDRTFELERSGRLKEKKIRTASAFYISEEGFQNSGSSTFTERRVVSYVHEFDHYIWYALQRVPIYVLNLGLAANLHLAPNGEFAPDAVEKLRESWKTREDSLYKVGMFQCIRIFQDGYEKANVILDNMVLKPIGVQRPMHWRGKQKEYKSFEIRELGAVFAFPGDGDPFADVDDKEAIRRFMNWERIMNLGYAKEYFHNFMDSVKELKISRVPFEEFKNDLKRRQSRI